MGYEVIFKFFTTEHTEGTEKIIGINFLKKCFPLTKRSVRIFPIGNPEYFMLELEDVAKMDYTHRLHDALTKKIIGAAIEVHRELGPGLLESAYEACLIYELHQNKLQVEQQKSLPIKYKDIKLDCGYRLDLVIEEKVVVEIKSVMELTAVHEAQLITYLKLSQCLVGLLMNFNVNLL